MSVTMTSCLTLRPHRILSSMSCLTSSSHWSQRMKVPAFTNMIIIYVCTCMGVCCVCVRVCVCVCVRERERATIVGFRPYRKTGNFGEEKLW